MLAGIIFIDFRKIFHSWFYFQIQFNSAKDKHVRTVYSLQGTSSDPAHLQLVLHTTEGLILLKDSAENATLSRLLLKHYFSLSMLFVYMLLCVYLLLTTITVP